MRWGERREWGKGAKGRVGRGALKGQEVERGRGGEKRGGMGRVGVGRRERGGAESGRWKEGGGGDV